MQLPVGRWYKAIRKRHSTRSYNGQAVESEKLESVKEACEKLSMSGARAVLALENIDKVFKGAIGPYGKVKGAPAYVAFIGDTSVPNFQEEVGYVGEGVVLEATSLGLATCWVGGFFRPEAVAAGIELGKSERVLAVTPIGYPSKRRAFDEKLMKSFAKSHARKELSELVGGLSPENWMQWMDTALRAARLAPSAVNRQPWRFMVDKNSITMSVDSPEDTYKISKRLDCGIAMMHIELGARRAGVEGRWEYLDYPYVARFVVD